MAKFVSLIRSIKIDHLIFSLFCACVIIIPSYYDSTAASVFSAPKLFALRIITLLLIFLFILKGFKEKKVTFIKTPFNYFLLTYAFICLLNVIFSVQPLTSLFGNQGRFLGLFTYLNYFILSFLALNFFSHNKKFLRYLIIVSFSTAFLISIWAIFQSYGKFITAEWEFKPEDRVFATFGHANHFGAYLAFHLMLLPAFLFDFKKYWQRLLLLLPIIPMFWALIETASRGALLALIGAIFICLIVLASTRNKIFTKKNLKTTGLIFIILTVLILIFHQPLINKIQTLPVIKRTVGTVEFLKQGNLPDRVSWWFSSFSMIKDRPFLGHGLSTFKDIYSLYRRSDYRIPLDEQDFNMPETAHMEYFNIAVTQGIIGLIFYLFLVGYAMFSLIKYIKNNQENRFLALGIFGALIIYLLQVLLSFGEIATLTFFYLFLGLGVSFISSEKKVIVKNKLINKIVFSLIIIFISAGFYYSYNHFKVEKLYYLALLADKLEKPKQSTEYYDALLSEMPYEYEYWAGMGDSAFNGAIQEISKDISNADIVKLYLEVSEKAYLNAINIIEIYPKLHGNLGITYNIAYKIYDQLNDKTAAEAYHQKMISEYELAIKYSPVNPLYAYNLAKILYLDDDCQNAVKYFNEALKRRNPYKDTVDLLANCNAKLIN